MNPLYVAGSHQAVYQLQFTSREWVFVLFVRVHAMGPPGRGCENRRVSRVLRVPVRWGRVHPRPGTLLLIDLEHSSAVLLPLWCCALLPHTWTICCSFFQFSACTHGHIQYTQCPWWLLMVEIKALSSQTRRSNTPHTHEGGSARGWLLWCCQRLQLEAVTDVGRPTTTHETRARALTCCIIPTLQ